MVANKSTENILYRNALLLVVASQEEGPSERFLEETLQATRHTLRKAVVRRAYIDGIGENLWGGLSRKKRSDRLSEREQQLIINFWDTATTISPIA
jgi:hypothetical protein